MANFTRAYTIAFEGEDCVYKNKINNDNLIISLLKDIEALMTSKEKHKIQRNINGKVMRVHAYSWANTFSERHVIVPFGKLKSSNKPYGMDPETQALKVFPDDMFDVNSLAYHKDYNIALITTNQLGPSESDIENYLNSFLKKGTSYRIKLKPIKENKGIEKIRNATQAKSITVSLDLGRTLNDFFVGEIQTEQNAINLIKTLANHAQTTLESKTFALTLGLGRSGKNDTLALDSLLEMLNAINISADCIKEIVVNYRDRNTEKIDVAKLKQSNVILTVSFKIKGSQLAPEYLSVNLEETLTEERPRFFEQINTYFKDASVLEGGYTFEKDMENLPVT